MTDTPDPLKLHDIKDECTYTRCYCEENVWKLCERISRSSPDQLNSCYAVFISNQDRQIPLWRQKARPSPNQYVIWDYHVVLLLIDGPYRLVYDLDTVLEFPCSIRSYLNKAIGSEQGMAPQFHRLFRVIKATDFVQHFASDRSHMLREDGSWMAPPPQYPPIKTTETDHNIDSFISMDASTGVGEVLSLAQLIHRVDPELTQIPSLLQS